MLSRLSQIAAQQDAAAAQARERQLERERERHRVEEAERAAAEARARFDASMHSLFAACDPDGDESVHQQDVLRLEMRHSLREGDERRVRQALDDFRRAGGREGGLAEQLSFGEFREQQLAKYAFRHVPVDAIPAYAEEEARLTLVERGGMGVRLHPGIRQALVEAFGLLNLSGNGGISPEEWVMAQRCARACGETEWISEASYVEARGPAGIAAPKERFIELSLCVFEDQGRREDEVHEAVLRLCGLLAKRSSRDTEMTPLLAVFVQVSPDPAFGLPQQAAKAHAGEAYERLGALRLPRDRRTMEELQAIVRLHLHLPEDMEMTLLLGDALPGGTMHHRMELLYSNWTPPQGCTLFVKNVRYSLPELAAVQMPFPAGSVRSQHLERLLTGRRWCVDWELQLLGDGQEDLALPVLPELAVGDALVVRVPRVSTSGTYIFAPIVRSNCTGMLGEPFEALDLASFAADGRPMEDGTSQDSKYWLTWVATHEGSCSLVVELSWEHHEEELAQQLGCGSPVAENSFARLGPLQVDVRQPDCRLEWAETERRHGLGVRAEAYLASRWTTLDQPLYRGRRDEGVVLWWTGKDWTAKPGNLRRARSKALQHRRSASDAPGAGELPNRQQLLPRLTANANTAQLGRRPLS